MKLKKLIITLIIITTLFFLGCSSEEEFQVENLDEITESQDDSGNVEDPSKNEEEMIVDYFENEEENIDLGELI